MISNYLHFYVFQDLLDDSSHCSHWSNKQIWLLSSILLYEQNSTCCLTQFQNIIQIFGKKLRINRITSGSCKFCEIEWGEWGLLIVDYMSKKGAISIFPYIKKLSKSFLLFPKVRKKWLKNSIPSTGWKMCGSTVHGYQFIF